MTTYKGGPKAAQKRYRESDKGKEKRIAFQKTEKYKEIKRAYNASEKGKSVRKALKARTPDKQRNCTQEFRAIIINFLLQRDGGLCKLCYQPLDNQRISIDHIIPVANGGLHIMNNVQLAHLECNIKKSNH